MKKILMALAIVGGLAVAAHADELASSYDTNGVAAHTRTAVSASTQVIVIDLSDTITYPHQKTGGIAISRIRTTFDAIASSSGTIRYGVVTGVDQSTGSVKWFANCPFNNGAIVFAYNFDDFYAPMYLRALVKPNGTTPYLMSNDTTAFNAAYQNDVVLPTGYGSNVTPAVGDIIMNITIQSGTLNNITSQIFYAGQKP